MDKRKQIVKQSRAYIKFENAIARSQNLTMLQEKLLGAFGDAAKGEESELDYNDMSRAAIVLAVGGMDAYYTDLFIEKFTPLLQGARKINDKTVSILEEAGLGIKEALELLLIDKPYERLTEYLYAYFERFVTQKFDIIDELYAAYGIKDFICSSQGIVSDRRGIDLENIKIFINRRHNIVHNADFDDNHSLKDIDISWVNRTIDDIFVLAGGSEMLIAKITTSKVVDNGCE